MYSLFLKSIFYISLLLSCICWLNLTFSYDLEDNEIYPLAENRIIESMCEKYDKDMREACEVQQKALEELKEMLHGHVFSQKIRFEEDFLRAYLTSNNYEVDKVFSKIQKLFNLRKNHPYFFQSVNLDSTLILAYRFITTLPQSHKKDSTAILCELGKWDPGKVPLQALKQIGFITVMQALRDPKAQESGISVILDFADVGIRYLKYCTLENMYLLNHVTFEVIPAKYVGFHIINGNFIMDLLLRMLKPFLSGSATDLVHIHSSVDELLDFYPTSILPVQHGGNLTEFHTDDWLRKANEQHDNYPAGGQKNIRLR